MLSMVSSPRCYEVSRLDWFTTRTLILSLGSVYSRSISESSVIRDGFEDTRGFVSMENWKIEMKLKNR